MNKQDMINELKNIESRLQDDRYTIRAIIKNLERFSKGEVK